MKVQREIPVSGDEEGDVVTLLKGIKNLLAESVQIQKETYTLLGKVIETQGAEYTVRVRTS